MKNIIEGNKLVAKFLAKQTGRKISTLPARMNYHSNWNSIMSVRDEVMKLGAVVVINRGCMITMDDYSDVVTKDSSVQEFPSERSLVWEALVNFIKAHNNMPAPAPVTTESKVPETKQTPVVA